MTNQVKIKRSAVPGKIPTISDVGLGELALNTYDGKLFTAKNDGALAIIEIGAASYQQLNTVGVSVENGYESRADNTISFDDVSQTFYNTPTGASFTIWAGQVAHVKTATQSVSITDSEGIWYFYYDTDGVLTTTRTFTPYIITLYTFCAEIYWDATNKKAIFLADERHGRLMPAAVHSYLHSTQHAKWSTGLSLTSFSAEGTGDIEANAQFAVTNGKYFDEDIEFNIVNGSPQQLSAFARIPILYMVGANWRKVAATDYPVAYGLAGTNTRLVYNQKVGNDWQLTEVGNNNFMLMHYFGTNDVTTPVMAIMGQAEYSTKSAAYSAARSELVAIDARGLPTLEYVPLGSVIFETNNVFNNVPKARIRTTNASNETYVDWRGTLVTSLVSDSLQAAPLSGTYVTMGPEAVLPNERVLTGTAGQITITDGGAGGNVVVAIDNSVLTSLAGKQDTLVSGTNIKTINGVSVLGSGDQADVILPLIASVTKDMSGFPNRTDTSLAFDESTRTFTLTPLNGNAHVWHLGTKYNLTATLSIVISDTNGTKWVRFDPVTQTLLEGSPNILGGDVIVAYFYWNVADQKAIVFGEERHGSHRDLQWHSSHHNESGTVWRSGGSVTYTLNSVTNTIGLGTPLVVADEDIVLSITNTVDTAVAHGQELFPNAVMPVLHYASSVYHSVFATTGQWLYAPGGRAYYNPVVGNTGTLVEAPDDTYVNYWIVAFTDIKDPVKALIGRSAFTSLDAAKAESFLDFGLPMPEKAALYKVTLHTKDTIANDGHIELANVEKSKADLSGSTAQSATSHDALTNRELVDQHPIAAITNLQTTLDGKAATAHAHAIADVTGLQTALDTLTSSAGTVTDVSVVSANGLSGSVANPTTTPAITLGTTVTGMLKGDGTSVAAAIAGVDYSVIVPGGLQFIQGLSVPVGAFSGTTVRADSNLSPVFTEGIQIWTANYTPSRTTSKIEMDGSFYVDCGTNNRRIVVAIWRTVGAVSTLIGVSSMFVTASGNGGEISIAFVDSPGTTSLCTYSMRCWVNNTATWYVARGATPVFNGQLAEQTIRLQEMS